MPPGAESQARSASSHALTHWANIAGFVEHRADVLRLQRCHAAIDSDSARELLALMG